MTAKVKLSELVAARSAAVHAVGILHAGEPLMVSGDFMIQNDKTHALGWAIHIQDAECVASTHNAADVLIEIAKAALEWRRTDRSDHYAKNEALRRLDEALTKVEP